MQLSWYGQASFGILSDEGVRIVTDPYDPALAGYKPFSDPADVVIMSSDNDDFHCNEHLVPKRDGARVINALEVAQNGGVTESHGVTFKAIQAMEHINHHLHDPDQNGMYRFVIDGIDIGHMGDMGNRLSAEQLEFFKGIDVLLALSGGFPTLSLDELKEVIDTVEPKLVIPMHFRTLRYIPRDSHWISEFLTYFPDEEVDFAFSDTVTLSKAELPEKTRALIIDYI